MQASPNNNSQTCIHDVPVTVIPTREWLDFQEPEVTYNVSFNIPKKRRNFISDALLIKMIALYFIG